MHVVSVIPQPLQRSISKENKLRSYPPVLRDKSSKKKKKTTRILTAYTAPRQPDTSSDSPAPARSTAHPRSPPS